MVFKPWDAIGTQPRHLLDDVPVSLSSHSLPVVKINDISDQTELDGTLIILPITLKAVFDSLVKHGKESKPVFEIEVWSSSTGGYDVDEEFVEDEQLYKIKENEDKENETKSLASKLQIWNIQKGLNAVYVDNFQNEQVIFFNLIVKEIIKRFDEGLTELLSLSPGNLPFQVGIAKLVNDQSKSKTIPFDNLVPPFYVTGVAASLISQEKYLKKDNLKASVIILQSEGVPGFEKVDLESIREASFWLVKKFGFHKDFVQDVEKLTSASKNINNFALYL